MPVSRPAVKSSGSVGRNESRPRPITTSSITSTGCRKSLRNGGGRTVRRSPFAAASTPASRSARNASPAATGSPSNRPTDDNSTSTGSWNAIGAVTSRPNGVSYG